MAIHARNEVDLEFLEYQQSSTDYLDKLNRFVKAMCSKKYFMQKRQSEIKQLATAVQKKPLEGAITAQIWLDLQGNCNV